MSKVAVIRVGEGDWERGFPVILRIAEEGKNPEVEVEGHLPGSAELPELYDDWRFLYRRLPVIVRLETPEDQQVHVSKPEECRQAANQLLQGFNQWLSCESFRPIRERLFEHFHPSEALRMTIQTADLQLRRLPWHQWDFFQRYRHAETVFSAPNFEKTAGGSSQGTLRILAILGNSENIDVEADRKFLEGLPGAETVFLVEPPQGKISEQLWNQPWDILFFAGHSCTEGNKGRMFINRTESLSLEQLQHGLRMAISRGLKLAIFNSCDGLGLARELESLSIPQAIVMREPVPDHVAQLFLKYFLGAFSRGMSLFSAVRQAREQLHDEGIERDIPGVSWLPAICQNPAAGTLSWPRKSYD